MTPDLRTGGAAIYLRLNWNEESKMSLGEQLEKMREASAGRIPPERRAIMMAAMQALRDTGVISRVAKVGDPLPAFALPDAAGETVRSDDLLKQGPLVVSFFRGVW